MTRSLASLPWLTLAAVLALAPFAAAEWYEGKPDCPPDMMCTTSAPVTEGATTGGATGAPADQQAGVASEAPAKRAADGTVHQVGLAALILGLAVTGDALRRR